MGRGRLSQEAALPQLQTVWKEIGQKGDGGGDFKRPKGVTRSPDLGKMECFTF